MSFSIAFGFLLWNLRVFSVISVGLLSNMAAVLSCPKIFSSPGILGSAMFRRVHLGVRECLNYGNSCQEENSYLAFFGVSVSASFKSLVENSFLFGVIVSPPPEFSV